jgi:hypothetical protein
MPSNPELPKSMPLSVLQSWPIALLLTLIAGYLDIVDHLSAYQVFTAHMSGNAAAIESVAVRRRVKRCNRLRTRRTRRRYSSLKRLLLVLTFCFASPIGAGFAQSYKVDSPESQSLTTYLRQHRLPLVGAQVLTGGSGNRRVVLYGFVATEFGKNDAARKALAYVENGLPVGTPAPNMENRIEIRPEISRMPTQSPPAIADTRHESLDQVLNDIDRYGVTMAPAEPNPR